MPHALSQVPDHVLRRELNTLATRDRTTTAELIAHIAEFEARQLHSPSGFPSMFAYCVQELRMSEDVAHKRIRVGRAARRFPVILPALADGRLHVSGLFLISDHLTESTAEELLSAAMNKSKSQIELLLAQRFPRADVPTRLEVIPGPGPGQPAAASPPPASNGPRPEACVEAGTPVSNPPVPGRVDGPVIPCQRPRVAPLAPERYALQVTVDQETHDLLRQARDLLGHSVPSGDIAEVLKRALKSLVSGLERAKYAATSQPRRINERASRDPRHIPAVVRRAVRARDCGRCTFVGDGGHRCSETRGLEFDHVDPVARGGEATVEGIRLRCRAHNQLEADRIFGAGFMDRKRAAARREAGPRQRPSPSP